jgi:mannosyltransferase
MKMPEHRSADPGIAVLAGCCLAALALRVYHLDFQSLWLDELFSVVFSGSGRTLREIATAYANDVHPLVYPLLLHVWLMVFGDTGLAARALSVVFGIAGVGAMYLAGRRCFDARTGAIAAILTTVNAFHIAYSQDARSYSLLFLVAALSYWAFIRVLSQPGWPTALAYGLVTAAAIHVHYYAFVMIFGQLAAALLMLAARRLTWRNVRPLLAAAAAAGLTALVWIGPLIRAMRLREAWPAPPRPLFLFEYFHGYFGDHLLLSLAFGALLVSLPFLLRAGSTADGATTGSLTTGSTVALLAGAAAVSLAAAYVRSILVVPMLVPKVTIAFLPVLLLLIALALSRVSPALLRNAIVAVVAVVSVVGLFRSGYYSEPRKEQWREAVAYMLADPDFDPEADVCLATLAPGFQFYVDQFGSQLKVEEAEPQRLLAAVNGRPVLPRVWLLVARDEDSVQDLRRELRQRWVRRERKVFLGTSVERWEPEDSSLQGPHDP